MIYHLEDTSKVRDIFAGWEDTCVWSAQQKVMGVILVTDTEAPRSAIAYVGCFAFCAGEPDRELLLGKPDGFFVMVPENEAWCTLMEECFPDCKRVTRYAIRKDTKFDRARLEQYRKMLPDGYELRRIDGELYDLCLTDPETASFVACFESKEQFLELGRGFVILRDGRIVSGASSYSRYLEGIEIEVDTMKEERQKGLGNNTVVLSWNHISFLNILNCFSNLISHILAPVTIGVRPHSKNCEAFVAAYLSQTHNICHPRRINPWAHIIARYHNILLKVFGNTIYIVSKLRIKNFF